MPRSLDAALLAAMNAGSFTPYFKVELLNADRVTVEFSTTEVMGFELDGLTAKVSFHDPAFVTSYATFRISRGIIVNGVPNFITSSQYYPTIDRYTKRVRQLEGHVFPIGYYSTPGDVTYSQVISTVCTAFNLDVTHADPAADFLGYQFYPDGRTFTLNNCKQFFTILRQKYLIFATDLGDDGLYFFQAKAALPPIGDFVTILPGIASLPGVGARKDKSFLSRDEAMTTHTSGDPANPIHNLGYIESTDDHPDRTYFTDTNEWIVKDIPPNLKYLDFDPITVQFDVYAMDVFPCKFKELFDQKLSPSWQYQARFLDIFGNTEGGQIPSTLEASAPYTPINVSNFDKNLNSTVNNLQALADRVDELDPAPAIYAGTAIDPPDDADEFPVIDVSLATPALKRFTWADMKSRQFAAFGPAVAAATAKTTPVAADRIPLEDSEIGSKAIKGLAWSELQTRLLTVSGDIVLGTHALKGAGQTLTDDTALNFAPGDTTGVIIVFSMLYNDWAIAIYKTTATNALTIILGGSNFTSATSTTLTGTTGADGKINIAVNSATGLFYIENRLGGSRTMRWVMFAGG